MRRRNNSGATCRMGRRCCTGVVGVPAIRAKRLRGTRRCTRSIRRSACPNMRIASCCRRWTSSRSTRWSRRHSISHQAVQRHTLTPARKGFHALSLHTLDPRTIEVRYTGVVGYARTRRSRRTRGGCNARRAGRSPAGRLHARHARRGRQGEPRRLHRAHDHAHGDSHRARRAGRRVERLRLSGGTGVRDPAHSRRASSIRAPKRSTGWRWRPSRSPTSRRRLNPPRRSDTPTPAPAARARHRRRVAPAHPAYRADRVPSCAVGRRIRVRR